MEPNDRCTQSMMKNYHMGRLKLEDPGGLSETEALKTVEDLAPAVTLCKRKSECLVNWQRKFKRITD